MTVDKTVSGVNRYLENLRRGLELYPDIVVHSVVLIQKSDMLFYRVNTEKGGVDAAIMLPLNMNPIVSGLYWMERYAGVVAGILLPYFEGMQRLIWHTHCINLSQLAVLLKQQLGGYIVTHLHCIPWKFTIENDPERFRELYRKYQNGQFDHFYDSPVEELTYRVSDRIICVTKAVREYLVKVVQIPLATLSVVYNGLEEWGDVSRQPPEDGGIHILYAGRISREKGVPCLLEAVERLRKQGYPVRLTLAGSGNKAFIRELTAKYADLEPDFTGYISTEDLAALYRGCTFGVIPSLHEQCSYVAMEMAMSAIPMIVSDVDGLGELFSDGVNALKVPLVYDEQLGLTPDVDILAQGMIRLAENRELCRRLGESARGLFFERFTTSRMTEETVGIYRSCFFRR